MNGSDLVGFDPGSRLSEIMSDPRLTGWAVTMALVMLLAGWLGGRLARRATSKAVGPIGGLSENTKVLVGRLAQYLTWTIAIGIALTFLGAQIQPVLAVAIIIGAIAVLALRGVADNIAAGVVLQTRQPVEVGDQTRSLGYTGVVREFTGRTVLIETFDGEEVHLPDQKVLENPLINNSASGARRTELEVRAASGDVDQVLDAITTVVAATDDVCDDPRPVSYITSIDPSSVTVLVRVWHPPGMSRQVASALCRGIHDALSAGSVDRAVVAPPPSAPSAPAPAL